METNPTQKIKAHKIISQYLTGNPSHPANAMRMLELFELALGIDEEDLIEKLIKFDAIPDDQIDDYINIATWQDKAEWLRVNGYQLKIGSMSGRINGYKWAAYTDAGDRYYGQTIGEVIEQVYEREGS